MKGIYLFREMMFKSSIKIFLKVAEIGTIDFIGCPCLTLIYPQNKEELFHQVLK